MEFHTLTKNLESFNLKIFTINDLAKLTNKTKDYLKTFLNYQIKKNKIYQYKKGNYSLFKIEDKFLYSLFFKDTYISLNSALEFYKRTTQQYINLELISKNILRDSVINKTKVNIHKTKYFFGFVKQKINNFEVLVADKEKLLIDCLLFLNTVYLSEINEFIRTTKFNIKKLKQYLLKINSSTLNKRVGYLLELNNIKLKLKFNDKYELLNTKLPKTKNLNKKWKLIINEELTNG